MVPEAILKIISDAFPDEVVEVVIEGVHPHVVVRSERWHELALFLRDDQRLRFDWLRCISAVDHIEDKLFTLVYDLHATQAGAKPSDNWTARNEIAIKVRVDRDDPHVASVADVWPAADWHEREAYDLFGIIFDGHPDLRRILCCDDWEGYPLRKDYEYPLEFHGIPAVTEYGQSRPQH